MEGFYKKLGFGLMKTGITNANSNRRGYKKVRNMIIALIFLFSLSHAAPALANWAMVYGTDNENDFVFNYDFIPSGAYYIYSDYFHDVAAAPDGGFVFTGTNATTVNNSEDYKKIGIWGGKISTTGEIAWEKQYGFGFGLGITATSDGNYVIAAYQTLYRTVGFFKISGDGSLIWKKSYGDIKTLASDILGLPFFYGARLPFRIKSTPDGGFIFAAYHSVYTGAGFETEFSHNDPWVVKVDTDGDLQWEIALSPEPLGNSVEPPRRFYDIMPDTDGNYIAVGASQSLGCIAVKLNADGQVLWKRAYPHLGPGVSVQETLDINGNPDGYALTAYDTTYVTTYGNTWAVLKIDRDTGDIIWRQKYDLPGWPSGLVTMPDRRLVVAGVTGDGTNQDWAFLRLDSTGQVLDCKVLATDDEYKETIFSLKNTLDGGIVAAGRTDHQMYATGGGGDAKLVKLDTQFDIAGCPQLTSIEVTATEGTHTASDLDQSEVYDTHCHVVVTEPPATIEPVSESVSLCREEANLKFQQQADTPDPAGIGETVTYTIVLENEGPQDATGVVVSGSVSSGENMVVGWSGDMTQDGLTYTCNVGDLAFGATETFSIVVTASEAGIMESRATAVGDQYDAWPDNNETFEDTTVEQPGLSVFIQDNPDPTCLGCGLSYTVTVTNFSAIDATGVVLTDTLPSGFDPSIYICSMGDPATLSQGVVTCDIGDLLAGQKATLTLGGTVTAAAVGALVNTADIIADGVAPLPQHADTEETAVQYPDLSVEISDWSDPVQVGYYLIYTVTATNLSTFPAQDVVVTDTLPPDTELISCAASQGTCTPETNTVTAEFGSLNGESSARITIVVKVLSEGTIVNTAEVTNVLGEDYDLANNVDTETTEITTWFKQDLGRFGGEERRPVSLATDPSGNIWMALIKGDGHLKVADNATGSWQITTFSGFVWDAALAVDDDGNVHMVYSEEITTEHNDQHHYLKYIHNKGGMWSQPQLLLNYERYYPFESLNIVVDSFGTIHVACIGHIDNTWDTHLWYFKSFMDSDVLKFTEHLQPALWSVSLAVEERVGASGYGHFSYLSYDVLNDESNQFGIGYTTQESVTWYPEIVYPEWGCAQCDGGYVTDIALDSQYRPHIVYASQENNTGWEHYWYATKNDDTWKHTRLADGYIYSCGCAIDLDANDGIHTVVYDVSESNGKISYVAKQGDAWETTNIYAMDNGRLPLLNPNIVVDDSQTVHIAFLDGNFHLQLHSSHLAGDMDLDRISDREEMGTDGTDPTWDGNNDGTPDFQQPHVASLKAWSDSGYVTLAAPEGTLLTDVQAVPNPSPLDAPAEAQFPYGFFTFKVLGIDPGASVAVTLFLPDNGQVLSYYKFGGTPGNADAHWYAFDFDNVTNTGVIIDGNAITLYLSDGLRGDADLNANGVIFEPGGPAVELPPGVGIGDVDGSGAVDLGDAVIVLKLLASLDAGVALHLMAEVNGDNRLGMAEVIYILQRISEKR